MRNTTDLKKFIADNIRSVKCVSELAAILNISEETIRKDFKRLEGITLCAFIRITRVEEAKKRLLYSRLSCAEICFAVGFQREESGSRIFKRVVGITMTEYRSRHGVHAADINRNGQPQIA